MFPQKLMNARSGASVGAVPFALRRLLFAGLTSSLAISATALSAQENQVLDTTNGNACVAAGGVLSDTNIFTALDNGTFGTGSGAPNEIPATNPYAADIVGGSFNSSYSGFDHGDYTIISNQVDRRNTSQFNGTQVDPVNGTNGRFFVSDPDDTTPVFGQTLTDLVPGRAYEASIWIADTEDAQNGFKNRLAVVRDPSGTPSTPPNYDIANPIFLSGFINSNGDDDENNPVVWQKYSFLYLHDLPTTSAAIGFRPNETGPSGRDVFMDEVRIAVCFLPADLVTRKVITPGTDSVVLEGGTVSFDISIENTGPGLASDVSVADVLPDGLTLVPSGVSIQGTTNSSGGMFIPATGVWEAGHIALNDTVTLTIEATVDPGTAASTLMNEILVAAQGNETDPSTVGDDLTEAVRIGAIPVGEPETINTGVIEAVTFDPFVDLTSDEDGLVQADSVSLVTPSGAQNIQTEQSGDVIGFTVEDEGTWAVNPTTGVVTFTPEEGLDSNPTAVGYTVRDNDGFTSVAALLAVTYGDRPIAQDDLVTGVQIGTMAEVDVFADNGSGVDTDPDGSLNAGTVAFVDPAATDESDNGFADQLVVTGQGTWNIDETSGLVTFTPEDDFTDSPSAVMYTVDDNEGNTSEPALITVTYTEAPTAVADESLGNVRGSTPIVDVLTNDSASPDRTLDASSVRLLDPSNDDPVTSILIENEGTWSVNPDTGAISFAPLDTFTGNPTLIDYVVADDQGNVSEPAAIMVTYTLAPAAVADESLGNENGTPVEVDVLANDSAAPGRSLVPSTVMLIDPATDTPVTSLIVPNQGTWTVDTGTGIVTFAPEDGFTDDPTPVSYVVSDDEGDTSEPATITVGYIPLINIPEIEEILSDDLLQTTIMLSGNASGISRAAADRLRMSRGQQCGQDINDLLRANPVRFASDKFFIDARNDAVLDEVARLLGECASSRFMIAGHTDSDAGDAYNIVLSQNRVDAVLTALTERGVAVERLRSQGFGERQPIATNATEEGQALNRRVEFILLDEENDMARACGEDGQLSRNVNGSGNNDGARVNGDFRSSGYNCLNSTYAETWAELNVTHQDDRGTLGMLNIGTLRERQNGNKLFGRFIEGYLSRNDVNTPDASGTITGVGLHAGLYGAHGTEGGLILSYYGSAAVGQHNFEIDTGAVADGNYTYGGIFAGAAVGGEQAFDDLVVRPRVGIDLAYAKAIGSEISVPDVDLEIDPATYARGFVELGMTHAFDDGTLDFTPRMFCATNGDADANACGFGGSLNYATVADTDDAQWDLTLDYEQISDRQTASVRVARSKSFFDGMGVSRSTFGATQTGAVEAGQMVEFNW